jgi:hypothetical protein
VQKEYELLHINRGGYAQSYLEGRRDEVEGPIRNANQLIELAIDFLSQLRGNGLDVRVGVVKSPSGESELQVRINIPDTVTRNPRDGEQDTPAVPVDDLPQL